MTRFGQVSVSRIAYRSPGRSNVHPLDAALNLPEEKHSHGLRKLTAIEAARGSMEAAGAAITRATGVTIGKRQVEELARRCAAHVEAFYLWRVTGPGGHAPDRAERTPAPRRAAAVHRHRRRSYACSIALFLRWCALTGRTWQAGIEQIELFMTWLAHAGPLVSGGAAGVVLSGSATPPARGARRINAVLAAVRGMTVHAVATGEAGGHLVPLLFEVADDRWRRDPWLWRPAP